jgi:hypothetical protein
MPTSFRRGTGGGTPWIHITKSPSDPPIRRALRPLTTSGRPPLRRVGTVLRSTLSFGRGLGTGIVRREQAPSTPGLSTRYGCPMVHGISRVWRPRQHQARSIPRWQRWQHRCAAIGWNALLNRCNAACPSLRDEWVAPMQRGVLAHRGCRAGCVQRSQLSRVTTATERIGLPTRATTTLPGASVVLRRRVPRHRVRLRGPGRCALPLRRLGHHRPPRRRDDRPRPHHGPHQAHGDRHGVSSPMFPVPQAGPSPVQRPHRRPPSPVVPPHRQTHLRQRPPRQRCLTRAASVPTTRDSRGPQGPRGTAFTVGTAPMHARVMPGRVRSPRHRCRVATTQIPRRVVHRAVRLRGAGSRATSRRAPLAPTVAARHVADLAARQQRQPSRPLPRAVSHRRSGSTRDEVTPTHDARPQRPPHRHSRPAPPSVCTGDSPPPFHCQRRHHRSRAKLGQAAAGGGVTTLHRSTSTDSLDAVVADRSRPLHERVAALAGTAPASESTASTSNTMTPPASVIDPVGAPRTVVHRQAATQAVQRLAGATPSSETGATTSAVAARSVTGASGAPQARRAPAVTSASTAAVSPIAGSSPAEPSAVHRGATVSRAATVVGPLLARHGRPFAGWPPASPSTLPPVVPRQRALTHQMLHRRPRARFVVRPPHPPRTRQRHRTPQRR